MCIRDRDVADVLVRHTIMIFKKERIVEIEKYSIRVELYHISLEAFAILQSVDPTVEMILHLESTFFHCIVDEINRSEVICMAEIVIILVNKWQPAVKKI